MKNPEAYGRDYYADNYVHRARYDALADAIFESTPGDGWPPQEVWDVGCGAGLIGDRLRGYWAICGVDGSASARADYVVDLESAWEPTQRHGAICIEVAEHLPGSAADNLVRIVASAASEWIVWSAAHPGQGGTGHINEQPAAYWLEKFRARGWVPDEKRTEQLRARMLTGNAQHVEYRQNFYVLVPGEGAKSSDPDLSSGGV